MFFKRTIQKLKNTEVIYNAFPQRLCNDVKFILKNLTYEISILNDHNFDIEFLLLSGERIIIPYRILSADKIKSNITFTKQQEIIYHCIFSRSSDGYVREKHIKALLQGQIIDWAFPFILKLSDEYVTEILNVIYQYLINHDNTQIKRFCKLNCAYFLYSYARMISYWNYFYRDRCFYYKNYIGRKLYKECFGYSKYLEKTTTRYKVKLTK